MIKKAMILAAGYGKRLLPLTLDCPKPLLKIGDETLLSNTIKFLQKYGINQVVINIHYLGDQIINYLHTNKFNLKINLIQEKDKILNTGGGVLNAIDHFSNEPFVIINPDTIWSEKYLEELKEMEKEFFINDRCKCSLLVVDKVKSFDKSFKGDFNLEQKLINRKKNNNELEYIYTGLQIMKPEVFSNENEKIFSINRIWDKLIKDNFLYGLKSKLFFNHISTLEIYKNLKKSFKY